MKLSFDTAYLPPKSIDLINSAEKLIITWDNDESINISTRDLRYFCACSSCRAKKIVGIPLINSAYEVKNIRIMGSTGIQVGFADGHDRGVYPWRYLLAIAEGDAEEFLHE